MRDMSQLSIGFFKVGRPYLELLDQISNTLIIRLLYSGLFVACGTISHCLLSPENNGGLADGAGLRDFSALKLFREVQYKTAPVECQRRASFLTKSCVIMLLCEDMKLLPEATR
jgi:hypothetical protein